MNCVLCSEPVTRSDGYLAARIRGVGLDVDGDDDEVEVCRWCSDWLARCLSLDVSPQVATAHADD